MPQSVDVTIATHAEMPEGSTDDRLLAEAIAAAGARVRFAVWNDGGIDWAASRLTVIRSTWDYHLDPAGWFAWLDAASAGTRLVNAAPILRWNSDKRYLLELERAGGRERLRQQAIVGRALRHLRVGGDRDVDGVGHRGAGPISGAGRRR